MKGKIILVGIGHEGLNLAMLHLARALGQDFETLSKNINNCIDNLQLQNHDVTKYEDIVIEELKLQTCEAYILEEKFESRSGWYIPRIIGTPSRGFRYQYKSTIRKQYNKPKFIWRIKKQKKNI